MNKHLSVLQESSVAVEDTLPSIHPSGASVFFLSSLQFTEVAPACHPCIGSQQPAAPAGPMHFLLGV